MTRTPATLPSAAADSSWSCCVFFERSRQGFVTMPPNPPLGNMIWKVFLVSGIARYAS